MDTDILIVGSGCAGLYCAWKLPRDRQITIITKADVTGNDSYLAQGGICMLKNSEDYESYYADTMRAGHYENDPVSVDIMIRSSQGVIQDLIDCGVRFAREADGSLAFTREGAHSDKRILYHKDITGQEITSHLLARVQELPNVRILSYTEMLDILEVGGKCAGVVVRRADESLDTIRANFTLLATGGIGGLYRHSTNFRHLTGDALAVALRHDIRLQNVNYVQIHPTTFYSEKAEDRSFLISESVRGEGAKLYDKNMQRFTNELLPRDLLSQEIRKQMDRDGTKHVWEDLRPIPARVLKEHFPNIVQHCLDAGYDVFKECIPVVPAQHYFMGGVQIDYEGRTSMDRLYAAGETACNGVHGRNRLASNSLLESLVFAARAAKDMATRADQTLPQAADMSVDVSRYEDTDAWSRENEQLVMDAIDKASGGAPSAAAYRTA